MLLGITDRLQEISRIEVKKRMGIVTTAYITCLALPFVIYALFYFNVVKSKPAFGSDIQEPVAKLISATGTGTAFLINSTTLLTARHVVGNSKAGDQVDLIFEHSKDQFHTKATIRYIAPTTQLPVDGKVPADYFLNDVAVLQVPAISNIEPLMLGESDAVANLNEVILIGYPGGDYSISKGSINSDSYQGLGLFKLDAASNPGNSGGPCILKEDNTVIGILVGGSPGYQGENVAIKINSVKQILKNAGIAY